MMNYTRIVWPAVTSECSFIKITLANKIYAMWICYCSFSIEYSFGWANERERQQSQQYLFKFEEHVFHLFYFLNCIKQIKNVFIPYDIAVKFNMNW